MKALLRTTGLLTAGIVTGFCAGAAWNILRTPTLPVAGEFESNARLSARTHYPDSSEDTILPVKVQISEKAFENGVRAVTEYPRSLLARINMIPNTGERLEFIRGVFTKLARDYPEYALELANDLSEPREKSMALRTLTIEWAFNESFESGDGLNVSLLGVVFALSASNPQKAALLAASELDGRERNFALAASAARWAEVDPAGAVEWASALQKEQGSTVVSLRVASAAADQDPTIAASFVSSLEDDRTRGWAVSQLASKWFEKDPVAVVAWTETLTDARDQSRAIASIAEKFAQRDPAAALEWASRIESPDLQQTAISEAIGEWAESNPAGAAKYALTSISSGSLQRTALEQVAREWSRKDKVSAVAWIQQIPDKSLRAAAMESINRREATRGHRGGR